MSKKSTSSQRPKRKNHRRTFDLANRLNQIQSRSFNAWHLPEPNLVFHKHFRLVDPKTGLGLYGPWALNEEGAPTQIRLGIIGTGETIDRAQQWIRRCANKVHPALPKKRNERVKDPIMFPSFPGMSSNTSFGCDFIVSDNHIETLSSSDIENIINTDDFIKRVNLAIGIIVERLEVISDKPSPPDVVICALPQEIDDYCQGGRPQRGKEVKIKLTPRERRVKKKIEENKKKGQLDLFEVFPDTLDEPKSDPTHYNFYRALKAKAMATDMPIQLAWPSTFIGTDSNEDDATRAWNFCVGLYYKAGWIPWKVEGLSQGTCYIGISFYREKEGTKLRTSMAQAFSDKGDGLVLRGEPFEWNKPGNSPHLTKEGAQSLLSEVLELYQKHLHHKPTRVVIHKSSRYWKEELEGFKEALKDIPYHDLLTLSYRGIRFLRVGYQPPSRGTVIELDRKNLILYTRGYIPYFQKYPGMRIPQPLEITEHHGDSSSNQICQEILSLSKLNWNTAAFACAEPITLAFSKQVGRILAEVPPGQEPKHWYRYYM